MTWPNSRPGPCSLTKEVVAWLTWCSCMQPLYSDLLIGIRCPMQYGCCILARGVLYMHGHVW